MPACRKFIQPVIDPKTCGLATLCSAGAGALSPGSPGPAALPGVCGPGCPLSGSLLWRFGGAGARPTLLNS